MLMSSVINVAAVIMSAQKMNGVVVLCVRPAWWPGVGALCRGSAVLSGSRHA